MKAEKIVRIELKNPALRRMRKNFRDIIELAVKQESSRLYAISREYRKRSQKATSPAEKERLEQKGRGLGMKVMNSIARFPNLLSNVNYGVGALRI